MWGFFFNTENTEKSEFHRERVLCETLFNSANSVLKFLFTPFCLKIKCSFVED